MTRYYLHTPDGKVPLPGTMRPSHLGRPQYQPTLVRARGYDDVYDLADGRPPPTVLQLVGQVQERSEAALNHLIDDLTAACAAATAYSRGDGDPVPLRSAHVYSTPDPASEYSSDAVLTLTLIPTKI